MKPPAVVRSTPHPHPGLQTCRLLQGYAYPEFNGDGIPKMPQIFLKSIHLNIFLDHSRGIGEASPVLSTNQEAENVLNERGKVIRDPVHSLIPIRSDEAYLLDLIDTPEFQRLRRIRQLGVSHITYPGAPREHQDTNHLRLCLDRSRGVHAAEQLIVARMHMSYQVYYHRVTRGWEAHMLCLFRLAHGLAGEGGLPMGTPRVVSLFFGQSGDIPHEDFLSFDEPQMIAAFHVWAENDGTDANAVRLRELSSAFLRRRKLFHATDIPGSDPMQASYEKLLSLKDQSKVEGIDYHHDNASFKGYKDFGSSVVHEGSESDPMEDGSEGIFLADGEPFSPSTIPVEKDSRSLITPALIQRGQFPLNRVFEMIAPAPEIST